MSLFEKYNIELQNLEGWSGGPWGWWEGVVRAAGTHLPLTASPALWEQTPPLPQPLKRVHKSKFSSSEEPKGSAMSSSLKLVRVPKLLQLLRL